MVPSERLAQKGDREQGKDYQRDHFLRDLELCSAKAVMPVAPTVCRNLQAVLEEGNPPTGQYGQPHRPALDLQVPIPGEGHEDIGKNKQNNGPHVDRFLVGSVRMNTWCELGKPE